MAITRRRFLKSVAGALAGASVLGAKHEPAAAQGNKRPNVLILMVDEMRWDCLGVAGHPIVATPNLDKLARQGCYFPRTYTVSPVCSPARMSLFSGRYRQVHGVVRNNVAPHPNEVTLPYILQAHGYATGMAGKLHLIGAGARGIEWYRMFRANDPGFPPNGLSYDDWIKKKHPEIKVNVAAVGVPETMVKPDPAHYSIGTALVPDEEFPTAWCADQAIAFIKQHAQQNKPWFFFCSMLKPHSPYVIPEPYATMYKPEDMILPKLSPELEAKVKAKIASITNWKQLRHYICDPNYLRPLMAHYYGSCTMVDAHCGRVLQTLDDLGLTDNTIVVFVADHGNMMGDKGRVFKGIMYEGSTRIPLIIRAPGFERGRIISDIVEITDVMPTILDLCGIPVYEGIQGKSLVGLMRGTERNWKNVAYSDLADKMIVQGRYKLMTYSGFVKRGEPPPWELYDLEDDPKEERNLAGERRYAALVAELQHKLEQKLAERPPAPKL